MMNLKTVLFFLTLTIISFTNSMTINQNQNSFIQESSPQQCKVGGVGEVTERPYVDTWGNYYMLDTVNRIQKKTKISKWTIFAKSTKPVQLLIYRKSGGRFTVVGKSALEKSAKMGANTFYLSKPINANKGDYIGWYVPNGGVIAFSGLPINKRQVLYTRQGKSATAFTQAGPRTYSINVSECDDSNESDESDDSGFVCGRKGGSDATKRGPHVDGWKNYYMIDQVNRIKGKASIYEFKINAKKLKPVQLIIYRKVGSKFTVVGKSLLETPKKLGLNVFEINHVIDVLPGDYVGWYVPQGGVIAFTKSVSGKWLVRNLNESTLFTGMGKSETAFQYSSPRTYSVEVIGC